MNNSKKNSQHLLAWHTSSWDFIRKCLQHNRLPQALLLQGNAGIGKDIFAKQLSKLVLCQVNTLDQSCGYCKSCLLYDANNHPDYFEIAPLGKSAVISIDQIRDLNQSLVQSSSNGGYQVVLLNPMTALTIAAANSLLKNLEEPLGKVIWLGIMHSREYLMPTLFSRMVALKFHITEKKQLAITNLAKAGLYEAMMLKSFGQSPILCKQLIDNEAWQLALHLLEHLGKSLVHRHSILHQEDFWAKQDTEQVLIWLYFLIADCVRLHTGVAIKHCVFSSENRKLQYVAKLFPLQMLFELLDQIGQSLQYQRSTTTFNSQYLLEKMFLLCQYKAESAKN